MRWTLDSGADSERNALLSGPAVGRGAPESNALFTFDDDPQDGPVRRSAITGKIIP